MTIKYLYTRINTNGCELEDVYLVQAFLSAKVTQPDTLIPDYKPDLFYLS